MPGRRDFKRKSGFRDARLIVVAAEGEETEKQYFEGLKTYVANPKIHVEVLERLDSASDPARVIALLDKFRSEYRLRKGYDQLWLVIDVDRWRSRKLAIIAKECAQKQYHLAVSNPCFEVWLLFHVQGLEAYSSERRNELFANKKEGSRTCIERELLTLLGSYNKANLDLGYFAPRASIAIQNARNSDHDPDARWPNELGSRVYLLAEVIVTQQNEH